MRISKAKGTREEYFKDLTGKKVRRGQVVLFAAAPNHGKVSLKFGVVCDIVSNDEYPKIAAVTAGMELTPWGYDVHGKQLEWVDKKRKWSYDGKMGIHKGDLSHMIRIPESSIPGEVMKLVTEFKKHHTIDQ